jgi:hypothetical protein
MKSTYLVAMGACAAALLMASCGGMSSSMMNPAPASSADVVQYRQLALNVQSAATTHGQSMANGLISTQAGCQSAEQQYDGQVRPWISKMMTMSGSMDSLAAEHGGSMEADMGCDAQAMMQELDEHRSLACASVDMAPNRAETARHVAAMMSYTGHATERCDEMMSGLSGGAWGWSPMMSGCQMASGSGGMMPGGGMMMGGR